MLYLRRIAGNSMLPRFLPGQLVIGIRRFGRLKPGQVVIIEHEGKEKIKRVDKVDRDEIYVLGDHPEASTDSRHFCWLPLRSAKALVIWPR
jgi:phage repressor protein C with HTH and peptisase S24 domain